MTTSFTPREIVCELDRFIIGQGAAKRAVAVALRNRWRHQQLPPELRQEILPKNILMIGPTGVGKTEIARRLARLAKAPFLKVEATKFTEVGYVGRDVEQIIRDLLDIAVLQVREAHRREVQAKAELKAEERILTALVGEHATEETRSKFRSLLRKGDLNEREIDIQVADQSAAQMPPFMDIPGMPGAQMGMMNLGEMMGKMLGGQRSKTKHLRVDQALAALIAEESDGLLDQEALIAEAITLVEQSGIVFLDEIDKICTRNEARGGEVSREGVQRDLLPLIEGTTVSTKHGLVRTDHILFIASGAFHIAKPADLLPELQGRLPIRVELTSLSQSDFVRILADTEASLIHQYKALLSTEQVVLDFTPEGIITIAELAAHINQQVENIGARRLHTVLEKLLEDISFSAPDRSGSTLVIDRAYVQQAVGDLARNTDLSKFIL